MDSDRSLKKTRKVKRRQLPELKLGNYGLNSADQGADFLTSFSRLGSKKSSPEAEPNPKHWTITSEGFPPGVTVDELKKYGRRKQLAHLIPRDNLQLEEGSLKPYKSEYKRRFQAYPPSIFPESQPEKKTEAENESDVNFLPEYRKSFVDHPRVRPVLRRPQNNLFLFSDHPMEISTEKTSQYVPIFNYERRKLLRRSTALKPEGEMTSETEVRREFKEHKNPEKTQIIRRLPSLKLEGEFESLSTEQRDKFIAFLFGRRPILEKKKTTLKMEGDFDFLTEKTCSYVPHKLGERPHVRKRSTSLKLDGEVEFFPEYRNSFVDFPRTRPITYKPLENIRREGDFQALTETKTKFVNFENVSIPESAKPENNLHMEGQMEITPEYKTNFVNFPRERPFVKKPPNQLKPEGNLEILTESSQSFLDLGGVEKSESLRRPSNLKLVGNFDFNSENSDKYKKPAVFEKTEVPKISSNLKVEGEMDFVTEKAEKFSAMVPEQVTTAKRPSSLKLEGEFLFLPEYQKSYGVSEKSRDFLKPIQNLKSNPSSPRKTPKKKINLMEGEDKKSVLETPRRRLHTKRLKEASPEKYLKFESRNEDLNFKSNIENSSLEIGKNFENEKSVVSPKQFPAFQVLDVKGQIGCQSMKRDLVESEKSTSDEDNSTYRLEVSNSGSRSPGFYRNDQRVFTQPALDVKELENAESRARQRAENYVKIVKSPELPNYLLEEKANEKENRWKVSEKLYPLTPPDNVKKLSFVLLDNEKGDGSYNANIEKDVAERERGGDWMPDWMSSLPTA